MPHEPLVYRALGGYPVVGRSPFGWLLRIDSRSSELRGSNCFNAEFSGVPNGVIPQPRAAAPRLVHRSGYINVFALSRGRYASCCTILRSSSDVFGLRIDGASWLECLEQCCAFIDQRLVL